MVMNIVTNRKKWLSYYIETETNNRKSYIEIWTRMGASEETLEKGIGKQNERGWFSGT